MKWLYDLNYRKCFFLAGGNSMHLLEAASKFFDCVPVVHEVTAAIATEYFNETSPDGSKAFALVTAGPGLTNLVSGIAGAWLESRELLVVGGQVKSGDLARGQIRQRGIQEIDGVSIVKSITKLAILLDAPLPKYKFEEIVKESSTGRKGPVFLEICLDVSAAPALNEQEIVVKFDEKSRSHTSTEDLEHLRDLIRGAKRPLLLFGGGVDRKTAWTTLPIFEKYEMPIAATWTGADRVGDDYPFYAGRPNNFGMRWSNIFLQQSDLLIAVGTRLNLQQTGFAWDQFVPEGKIVHVDIDARELTKGHPKTDMKLQTESTVFIRELIDILEENRGQHNWKDWVEFLAIVRKELPLIEECHNVRDGYVDPYRFINSISIFLKSDDIIIPCSSGGTFTATQQAFVNSGTQKMVSNKGLASMGYGLAGAFGASQANPRDRIILFEGDGGFAQNLQELGTIAKNSSNIKIFLISNRGYASIRTTQKAYFDGHYVGCDEATGLGLPNWEKICEAFGIAFHAISDEDPFSERMLSHLNSNKPTLFVIEADPDQIYQPKITSTILKDGSMSSNPLHLMSPFLDKPKMDIVFKYLPRNHWEDEN
jgi:acetolactate synthase-1/2/3 large subunit